MTYKITSHIPVEYSSSLVNGLGPGLFFFLVFHIPLAFMMRRSALISTGAALLAVGIGLLVALLGKNPKHAFYAAAYITGAEVLWRMTEANVFWEIGKYATSAILLIAAIRMKAWKRSHLPILFLLLLLPSILITISKLGVSSTLRGELSFNLSGPLSLAVCVIFFSQIELFWKEIHRIVWLLVAPLIGIVTLAVYSILTTDNITFTTESNFITSGGFGPNQVSAVLGLGVVLLFLVAIQEKNILTRFFAVGCGFILLMESFLTFSRGGVYNAVICIALASLHFLRHSRLKFLLIFMLSITLLFGWYFVFPRLNDFTGGKLIDRFSELDTTRRTEIAVAELDLFYQNPIFGIGPGMAKFETANTLGLLTAAHTEYTRILSEHGLFGAVSILLLLIMALKAYQRAPTLISKAWVIALVGWSLAEMTHAAMRVVAISFIFGLAQAEWPKQDQATLHDL
jgi:hypothetical protein